MLFEAERYTFGEVEPINMHVVYILKSIADPSKHYVGITENLGKRLKAHNAGESVHTNKYKPWKIETYITFSGQQLAINFEKYLKKGSGYAFLKKRLL